MRMDRTTLTAKEAARHIGISYWLLLELTKKKEIPFIAAGGRKLFRKESLDLWMDNKELLSIQDPDSSTPPNFSKLRKA